MVAESVHFMDSDPGAFNRPELKQAARALGHSLTIIRVRTKELEEDPNTLAEQPGMTGAGFNGKSIEAPRVFVFVDVGGCRKPSRALLASLTSSSAVHGSHNSKAWQIELQKLAVSRTAPTTHRWLACLSEWRKVMVNFAPLPPGNNVSVASLAIRFWFWR